MRLFRLSALALVFVLAAPSLPAVEETEEVPWARVMFPDLQRSLERLRNSHFQALWSMQAAAPLRAQWQQLDEQVATTMPFTLDDLLAHLKNGVIELHGIDENQEPQVSALVDVGALVEPVWGMLKEAFGPADAQGFMTLDDGLQGQRLDNALHVTVVPEKAPPREPAASDFDVQLEFSYHEMEDFWLHLLAENSDPDYQFGVRLVADTVVALSAGTTILSDGIADISHLQLRPNWRDNLPPLELSLAAIDRMPADTLLLIAAALDSPAILEHPLLVERGARQALSNGLHDALQDSVMAELVEQAVVESRGTVVVAVLPSAPFPALVLQLPSSPGLHELLAQTLPEFDARLPAVGGRSRINVVPMLPITIARTDENILLTTHPTFAQVWLRGEGGGLLQAATWAEVMAERGDAGQVALAGFSDTPRILQLALAYSTMLGSVLPDPGVREATIETLNTLRTRVGIGHLLLSHDQAGITLRSKGMTSLGLGSSPLLAGMVLPGIIQARARARDFVALNNVRDLSVDIFTYADAQGAYPRSLAQMNETLDDLRGQLRHPHAPQHPEPYLYIPPAAGWAHARQPILIQDPAITAGEHSVVSFGDLSVRTVYGADAQRLYDRAREILGDIGPEGGATWEQWQPLIEDIFP